MKVDIRRVLYFFQNQKTSHKGNSIFKVKHGHFQETFQICDLTVFEKALTHCMIYLGLIGAWYGYNNKELTDAFVFAKNVCTSVKFSNGHFKSSHN